MYERMIKNPNMFAWGKAMMRQNFNSSMPLWNRFLMRALAFKAEYLETRLYSTDCSSEMFLNFLLKHLMNTEISNPESTSAGDDPNQQDDDGDAGVSVESVGVEDERGAGSDGGDDTE